MIVEDIPERSFNNYIGLRGWTKYMDGFHMFGLFLPHWQNKRWWAL